MFQHLFGFVFIFIITIQLVYINSQSCKLKTGKDGQCKMFEHCHKAREYDDNGTICGSGQWPDVCCEFKPEDFVENPFGRIARKECQKHMDTLFEWQNFGYVFGGINARPKEFTYMAALGYGPIDSIKWLCGGSLISAKHILTAAHCLASVQDGPVRYVGLGDLDLNQTNDDAQPQAFLVKKTIPHPEFKRPSTYHDIAILELDRPVKFTDYVKPACLDFGQWEVNNVTPHYATGWGLVDTEGARSSHLQEVVLLKYEFAVCSEAYPMNRRRLNLGLQDSQFCAGGGLNKRKDTCQGDSGGPLTITNNDIRYERYKGYIVVGVTSFGKMCGITDAPGVYTKVQSYIPWIESIVWPEKQSATSENPLNRDVHYFV